MSLVLDEDMIKKYFLVQKPLNLILRTKINHFSKIFEKHLKQMLITHQIFVKKLNILSYFQTKKKEKLIFIGSWKL